MTPGDRHGDRQPRGARPEDPGQSDRLAELERRIGQLESQSDEEFGGFTRWDWVVCAVGAVALPLAIAIWFAG